MEAEARAVFGASRVLPRIRWNPRLWSSHTGVILPTPDGWIDEVGLAIEVDSKEFHSSPADWPGGWSGTTSWRRGAAVLHLVPYRIRRDPAATLRTVEAAYLARHRAGTRAAVRMLG